MNHNSQLEFLDALAEEINCQTETTRGIWSGSIEGTLMSVIFVGSVRRCDVKYLDSAKVAVKSFKPSFPHVEIIYLQDPQSLERMEEIFHSNEPWPTTKEKDHQNEVSAAPVVPIIDGSETIADDSNPKTKLK